jgi:DhnA family fructose-bisphosphate aldolase class Ia
MDFKTARMNRLFGPDGRCLDVAVDHGMFNERGFLDGIEDMPKAVATLAQAGPDAIQLGPGQAPLLQEIPGKAKPALVLRTDIANVYGKKLPEALWSRLIEDPLGQALRLDAACVVVNLLLLPDQPDLHGQCVDNINRLKPECEEVGMPLMVEPLVMQANARAGGYMVDGDLDKILPLVRQAAELGADIIKADPCDDLNQYHKVVQVGRCPVLVRGGGKVEEKELFERTQKVLDQGAAGIVYGRNIIQHPAPGKITRALMAMLHEKAGVSGALKIVA